MKTVPRGIEDGCWAGYAVRVVRKAGTCSYWHGAVRGGECGAALNVGDYYVEGEMRGNGGFGRHRWCLQCAGVRVTDDLRAVSVAEHVEAPHA